MLQPALTQCSRLLQLGCLVLSCHAGAAPLLVNGGFEAIPISANPHLIHSGNLPPGFGWTPVGTVALYERGLGYPPLAGAQTLTVADPQAGIEQTVSVVPGLAYTLSWWAASLASDASYHYSLRIQGEKLIVLMDFLGTESPDAPRAETITFTPAAATITIRLQRRSESQSPVAWDAFVLSEGNEAPDTDADGFTDLNDGCLLSDLRQQVWVADKNSNVRNQVHGAAVDHQGCSLADHVRRALLQAALSARHPTKRDRVQKNRFVDAAEANLERLASFTTADERKAILRAVRMVDGAEFLP